jgi:hypothetical protein
MLQSLVGIIASSGGVAGGDYESIATVTVGAGGASSISFTSIPSTYQHLQVRGIARSTYASGNIDILQMQINSDTGNNYAWHWLFGDGSSAGAGAASTTSNITFRDINNANTTASTFGAAVIDILDYSNTNKYKTTRTLVGYDANGNGKINFDSGVWMSTSAISSFTIVCGNANFAQYSSFALYGIKG